MRSAWGVLFVAIFIFQSGCAGIGECVDDSFAKAKWVQPGLYTEVRAKLQTNPSATEVFFENQNLTNMWVRVSVSPGDQAYADASLNGPTRRFPLDQVEDVVHELFVDNNVTFNPPGRLKPEYAHCIL